MTSPSPRKKMAIKYKILIIVLLILIFPVVFSINQHIHLENPFNNISNSKSVDINLTSNNNTNISNNNTAIETLSYKIYKAKKPVACASVFIQIDNNSYVFGYRRDADDPSDQYINRMSFDGIMDDESSKNITGESFVHTVISNNGWCFGIGGLDNCEINKKIEKIGASIIMKGDITYDDMNSIHKYIRSLGAGHFMIKSPEGEVGMVSHFNGNTKIDIFKLEKRDYVVVPNSPSFFHKGTLSTYKDDPINGLFNLLGNDGFGVNRRDDIVYSVSRNNNTKVDVYVANDDGKYVRRSTAGLKDDVIFNGKRTDKNSIPVIPDKLYLGNTII
ncbi:MAG: hypothetical protein LBV42_01080 [Methanobrevibacter sp.]|jgi:hypothetical protein|nr:hypothetical protein [Methanobrevibacter sp.]